MGESHGWGVEWAKEGAVWTVRGSRDGRKLNGVRYVRCFSGHLI